VVAAMGNMEDQLAMIFAIAAGLISIISGLNKSAAFSRSLSSMKYFEKSNALKPLMNVLKPDVATRTPTTVKRIIAIAGPLINIVSGMCFIQHVMPIPVNTMIIPAKYIIIPPYNFK
jgi:hypothetical protein